MCGLGKFVRKITTPNKVNLEEKNNNTKTSQNKTIPKSPTTPNVVGQKTSEYFNQTEKKEEEKEKEKEKKRKKELKNKLDRLMYKELVSEV